MRCSLPSHRLQRHFEGTSERDSIQSRPAPEPLEGAALYFSAAGGLTRASGAYVFFYSLLVVIVGICYKAYLGEPAQSNLRDPRTDIEIYVGSITAMLA